MSAFMAARTGRAPAGEQRLHLGRPAVQHVRVRQVVEVQVCGGDADIALPHQLEKILLLPGGGGLQELLHAVVGLAVPLEVLLRPVLLIAVPDE